MSKLVLIGIPIYESITTHSGEPLVPIFMVAALGCCMGVYVFFENVFERKKLARLENERDKLIGEFWRPKTEINKRLQRLTDELLPLFPGMPRVKAKMVHAPINEPSHSGSGLPCLAYCQPSHTLNGFKFKHSVICVKEEHYHKTKRDDLIHTLKHELIHAWLFWKGLDTGHNTEFNKKAREIGVREHWD